MFSILKDKLMATVSCLTDFSFLISRFFEVADFRLTTKATYASALKAFFRWCRNEKISVPAESDIRHWRSFLLKHYALASAQTYLTVVKLFFRWTALNGFYQDISYGIRRIRLGKSPTRDFLPVSDVKRVLSFLKNSRHFRDYVMISLMVTCGLRIGEVSRLDRSDLFSIGNQTMLLIHGKGHDGRSESIAVSDEIAKLLKDYLKWKESLFKQSVSPKDPMFVSLGHRSIGKRLCTRSISRIVKSALRHASFDSPRLTAHSLRHTTVTLSLQAGASLQEVQQYARHSRIETTQIYAHNLQRLMNPCSRLVTRLIGQFGWKKKNQNNFSSSTCPPITYSKT